MKPYSSKACKILNINHQFRKAPLSNFFNQVEFQYSGVKFADKYKKDGLGQGILSRKTSHFNAKQIVEICEKKYPKK